ncbi:MAG: hypothetical protein HQL03_13980 [Nitrospirae bacterium]|nr:hypothetical protein [Nitrospirota bacterium]MBF0591648.1 hypothetical protein [Nitrospirota bacterium]
MQPAPWSSLWILVVVLMVVVGIALVIGYNIYAVRHVRLEVSPEGLRIKGGLYGRSIALSSLVMTEAKVITLAQEPRLCPKIRTNGIGLHGYGQGWFTLQDDSKALLFMAMNERALYIPTTEGYVLLLTPGYPEGVLHTLNEIKKSNK